MAANKTPDVAAKMIGAQLQSLLKIPPIQKSEPATQEAHLDRSIQDPPSGQKPYSSRKVVEKENAPASSTKYFPPEASSRKIPPYDSNESVPRDRFGRPFQNLDRRGGGGGGGGRGRDRDFQNVNRRFTSTTSQYQRENEIPEDSRMNNSFNRNRGKLGGAGTVAGANTKRRSQTEGGRAYNATGTGVFEQTAQYQVKAPPLPVKVEASKPVEKEPDPKKAAPYERPPRFQSPPNRSDARLKFSVQQLLELDDCPADIKQSKEVFHEDNLSNNHTLWEILRMHAVVSLLGKQNSKFPNARYYCVACNYHMDNLKATLAHIMQERHYIGERLHFLAMTVSNSPEPSDEHTSYLTDLLMKTSKLEGLNQTERNQRLELVAKINEAMRAKNLDCQAVLFGSTVSGFGLRSSNVNINVNVGNEPSQLQVVENGMEQLTASTKISGPNDFSGIMGQLVDIIKALPNIKKDSVKEVYTTKCVSIHFYDEKIKAPCMVHFNNSSAVSAAELFAEYDKFDPRVRPLVLCFRYLAKILDIDDPEKGFLPPHCYAIMVIHFLQSRKDILPVLNVIPHVPDKPFATAAQAKLCWKTRNPHTANESIGLLWLQMLKYFAIEFNFKDCMVSMSRENRSINKDEKQWNRKINIEDPIIPKSNLSRSVTTYKLYDYIIEKFKIASHYFWTPRTKSGPLYDGILDDYHIRPEVRKNYTVPVRAPTKSEALQKMVRQIQKDKIMHADDADVSKEPKNMTIPAVDVMWRTKKYLFILYKDAPAIRNILYKNDYYYTFSAENFNDGSLPPIICKSCGAEGHFKAVCPEEAVPSFVPVRTPPTTTLSRLNTAININFARESIDRHDVSLREGILHDIKTLLLPAFPTVSLTLFGSTLNGFGMHSSDVDLCFTLDDVIVPPGERGIRMIDVPSVLEKIETALKSHRRIRDIVSIASAKVPIVKFYHEGHKVDGDVSLYNRLSIYNTNLLKAYVDLDERVAPLGLFLKKVVKLCRIGDASKGSLSSYCYILMLIHFLQNHSPPVLPVLQELEYSKPPGPNKCFEYCDGYCVEYEGDLNAVRAHWPHYGKNKESCSQLWIAFLNYYVEQFDNERYVITISQSKPLTRLEKCWHTEGLAIEDPFDKSHNLGGGLSRRMSVHILKTFQKCRMFFNQPLDKEPEGTLTQYYLDAKKIEVGNPPIDRQCRICCRIGHIARNCTYKYEVEGRDESLARENNQVAMTENNFNNRGPVDEAGEWRSLEISNRAKVEEHISPQLPLTISTEVYGDSLSANDPAVVMCSKLPNGSAGVLSSTKMTFGMDSDKNILSLFKNQSLISIATPPDASKVAPPDELQSKAEVQPAKDFNGLVNQSLTEVVFFGDIGGSNPEGDRIQAMLQKNDGVTFTFDFNSQSSHIAPENVENRTPFIGQPPPGFCSPNGTPINHSSALHRGLPFMTGQVHSTMVPLVPIAHSQPPHTLTYGHGPVSGIPYQGIPVENRPQDSRNGDNNERHQSAPPPGFAPIGVTNSVTPQVAHEVARNFHQAYSGGPNHSIGIAPIGVSFQQPNGFASSTTPSTPNLGEPGVGYRLNIETGDAPSAPPQPAMNFEIGPPSVSNPMMIPPPMISLHQSVSGFAGLNRVVTNGHPDVQEANAQQPPPFIKPGPVTVEHGYSSDYGGAMMQPPTNPMVSYGLSLSQAHHAPVVSALQMHHSQHHSPIPIQGNHFHHPVRPYFGAMGSMGNYYSYPPPPPVQAPPHIHDSSSLPVHSADPPAWK